MPAAGVPVRGAAGPGGAQHGCGAEFGEPRQQTASRRDAGQAGETLDNICHSYNTTNSNHRAELVVPGRPTAYLRWAMVTLIVRPSPVMSARNSGASRIVSNAC